MQISRTLVTVAVLLSALLTGCSGSAPTAVGLTAWDRVELISEAAEPIVSVAAPEGSKVNKGDLVLSQDPQRLGEQMAQATAAREQAQARLAELRRGPRSQRIEEGQAQLDGARSKLKEAQQNLARISNLRKKGVATAAELDDAEAARDAAQSDVQSARANLDALLEGTTVEELDQAEAALRQAQAHEREVRVSLDRLSVTAPVSGRVDALPFKIGERPPAGSTVAVLLSGPTPYARVYVPEPYRTRVNPGDTLPVHVDGQQGTLHGKVRRISSDPAFTPFYALTEHDRSRLSYVAEITLPADRAADLPAGVPVQVDLSDLDHE